MKNARLSNEFLIRTSLLLALAALIAAPAAAQERGTEPLPPREAELSQEAVEAYEDVDVPAFARIRDAREGLRVLREDGYEEDVSRNAPLYVGDTLRTTGQQRVEVQFPYGELVRLDRGSELEIYAIADPADPFSARETLVGLARGSLHASVSEPRGGEGYRVDTPSASVYPLVESRFRVDVEPGGDIRISVERGRVEVAGESGSRVLESGERVRVRAGQGPGTPYRYNVMVGDSFDDWVIARDESYALARAPGPEYEELPDEVRPYYSELSANGEWVETEEYGWVWNPSTGDDWRPYYDGAWADGPWGPVWVSDVSWSWPVYRYGRWEYTAFGWSWIPGRVFRPAHVYWYYGPDYVGWCPIGYYNRPVFIGSHVSFGLSFHWGHSWFDYHPWTFVHHHHFYHHHARRVYVDRHRVLGRHLKRGYVTRRAALGGRGHRHAQGVREGRAHTRALYDEFARGGRRGARKAESLRGERRVEASRREGTRSRLASGRSFRDIERSRLRARAERAERGQAERRRGVSSGVSRSRGDAPSRSRGSTSGRVGSRSGSRGGGDSKAGRTRGRGSAPNASERPVIRIRRPDQGSSPGASRRDEGAATRRGSSAGAAVRSPRSTRSFEKRSEGRARGGRAESTVRQRSRGEEGVKRFLGRIGDETRRSRGREQARQPSSRAGENRQRSVTRQQRGTSHRQRVESQSRSRGPSRPAIRSQRGSDRQRGNVGRSTRSTTPKAKQRSRGSIGSRSKSGGSKSSGRSRGSVGSRSKSGGKKSSGRSGRSSGGSRSRGKRR